MKKGINAWCFPTNFTVEQIFSAASQNKYDGVELNMSETVTQKSENQLDLALADNDILTYTTCENELKNILDVSNQYGVPISSVSTALHWTYPLTDNLEETREKGKDIVKKMIDAAAYFGADTVLVVPGIVTKSVSYQTAYDRSLEAFNELKSYAEQKKVTIGIENVWNKFLLTPLEMRDFIDKINSPYVKAYFDAGNVLQFSYPEHWVSVLGNRIAKVHIKDFDTQIGNITGFKPLLQGNMDWEALIESFKKIGYEGFITAELSPYPSNPAQLIIDTSAAMDYILSR